MDLLLLYIMIRDMFLFIIFSKLTIRPTPLIRLTPSQVRIRYDWLCYIYLLVETLQLAGFIFPLPGGVGDVYPTFAWPGYLTDWLAMLTNAFRVSPHLANHANIRYISRSNVSHHLNIQCNLIGMWV